MGYTPQNDGKDTGGNLGMHSNLSRTSQPNTNPNKGFQNVVARQTAGYGREQSRRTPEYRGEVGDGGPGKCSGTKSAAPAKKVRIETDLPMECQILFGWAGKMNFFLALRAQRL